MNERPDISRELIQKAAEKYSETTSLRAAIQLIPYIGSTLDTLIGGGGQKIQQRRIEHFISELNTRLNEIEASTRPPSDEELFDITLLALEHVVKTRSENKRARFAQIIAKQISAGGKFDAAETAIRLVGELDDIHIEILNAAFLAPLQPAPFDYLRVVTIAPTPLPTASGKPPPQLKEIFPDLSDEILRLICSELVAKGLLKDEGVGRWDTKGMEYFTTTTLTHWLFSWLRIEVRNN